MASIIAAEGEPAERWACGGVPSRGTDLSMLETSEGEHGDTLAEEAFFKDSDASAAEAGETSSNESTIRAATFLKNVYGLIVFFTRSRCPQTRTDIVIPTHLFISPDAFRIF